VALWQQARKESSQSHYDLLDVKRKATKAEIIKAFSRRVAEQPAPDMLEKLQDAFRALSVEDTRRDYDKELSKLRMKTKRISRNPRVDVGALEFYKSHFDLPGPHVPFRYSIPDVDGIPTTWRGFPLFDEVRRWRVLRLHKNLHTDDVAALDRLKFNWSSHAAAFIARLYILSVYKQVHGHLNVPAKFVVPRSAPWPQPFWDNNLGRAVTDMRRKNHARYRNFHHLFSKLGLDLGPQLDRRGFDAVKLALEAYSKVFGHLRVPRTFIVPEKSDEWPPITWGLHLGYNLHNISRGRAFSARQGELRALGLDLELMKKMRGGTHRGEG
jgi:hypothetical protein